MAPHRHRDPGSLIARVRWGNVARLAAIVGAGALIALGPRGCGGQDEPPALPVDPPAAKPQPEPPALTPPATPPPGTEAERPSKPSKPKQARRRRSRRPKDRANRPAPQATPPPAAAAPPTPAPRRRWARPAPRTPEFL